MTKKVWDGTDLQSLPSEHLVEICAKMEAHGKELAGVRLGLMGDGVRPNYQIKAPSGLFAYNGINHELDARSDQYLAKNLSDLHSYGDVESAIDHSPKSEAVARKLSWDFWTSNGHQYVKPSPENWEKVIHEIMRGVPVKVAFDALVKRKP